MADKLTPWFPGDVKPDRAGEYLVSRLVWRHTRFVRSVHRLEFRGRNWHYTARSRMSYPGSLAAMVPGESFWRGLASSPRKR